MNRQRLNDIFPAAGITRNGVFGHMYNALSNDTRPQWLSSVNLALRLDRVFSGKYGRQIISPYLEQYLTNGAISDADADMIAGDVYAIHAEQWARKYALLSLEYNPISNYDMTETEETSTETSGETSNSVTSSGYESTAHSATGTIRDTLTENGTRTLTKGYAGTETNALTKSGTETHTTAYTGEKQITLDKVGAERTIESWETSQNVTTTESGTETEQRDVYAFNSENYEPANKTQRGFNGRQSSTVTTLPPHTTETAQRDRKDTTKETYDGRRDTLTDTYTDRTDSAVKSFNGRQDTETESFAGRTSERVTDDSGHTATERTDKNLTDSASGTHSASGTVNRTLSRSGNIGVTTNQQMAQSEIALWQWNFFYDVFADVRRELTIGAY